MPDAVITTTSKGWPLLDSKNFIDVTPEYTKQLANKLENGDARVAEAINAARDAREAAATLPAAMAAGSFQGTFKGGIAANDFQIPLPSGRFQTTPVIAITVVGTNSQLVNIEAHVYSASRDSFTVRANGVNVPQHITINPLTINWIAVEYNG